MKKEQPPMSPIRRILNYFIVIFFFMVLVGVALGPSGSNGHAVQSVAMQLSREIGVCLSEYAKDHGGHYPEGKTSTEVFQQLLDENYVSDPTLFYLKLTNIPGKISPESTHLTAENVCWDVTCCVDASAPDGLPIVFLTGYKITYQRGSPASRRVEAPLPPPRTWDEWLYGTPFWKQPFIAVCYKSNSARWIKADSDGSIPNFIPADFDPKGKTYRQLTP